MSVRIIVGDCREVLKSLPDESVHCVVTSPPYWGLRDYGVPPTIWGGDGDCDHEWGATVIERATNHTDKRRWQHTRNGRDEEQPKHKRVGWLRSEIPQGQFCQHCGAWAGAHGLEPDHELFVENEVRIFRDVHRILRSDGTLWLNLGDSYASGGRGGNPTEATSGLQGGQETQRASMIKRAMAVATGLKSKDLCGVPWRVALALQADGWFLRQDIVWSKPNPMPESVTDRCTKAHEYLFLLAKSERYYFDADAIKEKSLTADIRRPYGSPGANELDGRQKPQGNGQPRQPKTKFPNGWEHKPGAHGTIHREGRSETRYVATDIGIMRNKRSVWEVPTSPMPEAHFATFPPALIEPCILAGCPTGGAVLDPFGGAGTTGLVADQLQRNATLIELNPDYADMAARRIKNAAPMFADVQLENFSASVPVASASSPTANASGPPHDQG